MGEMSHEGEPAGSAEIAAACRDFLEDEDCEEIAAMDPEEALEAAISWLDSSPNFQGVAIEYFIEKGILE